MALGSTFCFVFVGGGVILKQTTLYHILSFLLEEKVKLLCVPPGLPRMKKKKTHNQKAEVKVWETAGEGEQ